MPNWCENSVNVRGNFEKLESLFNRAKEVGLLESIIPIGEWDYSKAIDSWGTKWDVDFLEFSNLEKDAEGEDGDLFLVFDSAWGPPEEVYKKLAEDFKVEGYYIEPGVEFCGEFCNENAGDILNFNRWESFTNLEEEVIAGMGTDLRFVVKDHIDWMEDCESEEEENEEEEEE